MKIRMKGNSLRLRVGRSELARFLEGGIIEETIRLGVSPEASFTYSLELASPGSTATRVRYAPCDLAIVVTPAQAALWRRGDQVGIYTHVDVGTAKALEVVVEKDFACLDGSDSDNVDTFANPGLAATCEAG